MRMKGVVAVAAVVVAAALGGYFALNRYAGDRVEEEVAAAFTALKAGGAAATHGAIATESASRAVTIADVAIASPDGNASLKIGKVAVSGLGLPKDGRVGADTVILEAVEMTSRGADGGSAVVTLPQMRIEGYSGPLAFGAVAGTPSARTISGVLKELSRITAARVAAPQLVARLSFGDSLPRAEVTYTGLAAVGIDAGHVRELTADAIAFTVTPPEQDDAGPVSGDVEKVAVSDLVLAPLVALAGVGEAGAQAKARPFQTVYGRMAAGPYRLKHPGGTASAAAVEVKEVALRPAAGLTLEDVARLKTLAAAVEGGDDAAAPELLILSARFLDAFAVRSVVVTGTQSEDKAGKGRVASTRLEDLSAGRIARLSFEGLEGTDEEGRPAKIGSLTVDKLDLAKILTLAADEGLPPPREVFTVLQGFELKDAEVPYVGENAAGTPIRIGRLSFSWGEMLGELPTRLSVKLENAVAPIDAGDGEPFTYLANAGMTSATVSAALDVAYDANAAVLTVKPASLMVDKAFSVSFSGGLGNVPAAAFESEEAAAAAFGEVTAQPVSLTVTNLGLAQLMLAQLSEASGVTPEEMRADLIAQVDEMAPLFSLFSADVPEVAAVLKKFIAAPGTLTLTATPKDNTPLMPLLTGDGPGALLQAFTVTAEAKP